MLSLPSTSDARPWYGATRGRAVLVVSQGAGGQMSEGEAVSLWALQWYSRSRQYGVERHFLWDGPDTPLLYCTRREARADALKRYGYIKTRPDLRTEPHGWRLPQPVRVNVVIRAAQPKEEP